MEKDVGLKEHQSDKLSCKQLADEFYLLHCRLDRV